MKLILFIIIFLCAAESVHKGSKELNYKKRAKVCYVNVVKKVMKFPFSVNIIIYIYEYRELSPTGNQF